MDELAGLLSRERVLLELLLFKLTSLRHLLASGDARFLAWAGEEVTNATDAVRQAELHRSLVVAGLAADRGISPDELSLRSLAEESEEPWRTIFSDHRSAFIAIAEEIHEATLATRRLAVAGGNAVTETLDKLNEDLRGDGHRATAGAGTYGPGASWERSIPAARVSWTL